MEARSIWAVWGSRGRLRIQAHVPSWVTQPSSLRRLIAMTTYAAFVATAHSRGRVRSPLRRSPRVEAALVARWENAQDEDLWSVLDAAWLVGISPGTITARIRSGALPGTREAHGWRRIRTADLRPLVDQGLRQYGPGHEDP